MTIDLSADVGEGADDLPLFRFLSSVSVGCGAHAGDRRTMEACVVEAARLGVSVGAHPGYPDRANFGRVAMDMAPDDLAATLTQQLRELTSICRDHGVELRHVKPHGALYNQAATDPALADVIARSIAGIDRTLTFVGLAGSAMLAAAEAVGLRAGAEAFADRRYRADGTLASRGEPDALIDDPSQAAGQALAIVRGDPIPTVDGDPIVLAAETICVHSDTPGAQAIARAVREKLEVNGVEVAPLAGR